jgi:hypothetical protein
VAIFIASVCAPTILNESRVLLEYHAAQRGSIFRWQTRRH